MTHLICQKQRLILKGGRLIRENEVFEVEEPTASEYINGGIAKPAPRTEPAKQEEPESEPVQAEAGEAPVTVPQPGNKKRNR
jgi:hypothetical protein